MGHYWSEMRPEPNKEALALYPRYRKIQEELDTIPIGKMTIPELKAVQKFMARCYQDYELNSPFVATSVTDEMNNMQKIIKKCSS